MFRLGRLDVLPTSTWESRKASREHIGLRKLLRRAREEDRRKWAPYRTVASCILWRLIDTVTPVPRSSALRLARHSLLANHRSHGRALHMRTLVS